MQTIASVSDESPAVIDNGRRAKGGLTILADTNTAARCTHIRSTKYFIHIKIDDTHLINCYIPPSADDQELTDTFEYVDTLAGNIILCGDFNCRLGHISNDNVKEKRGELCLQYMTDANLTLEHPEEGRWTSNSHLGRGIPDHIFTNGTPITKYSILYGVAISDHWPLCFKATTQMAREIKPFTRWNVRLFTEQTVKEDYDRLLTDRLAEIATDDNALQTVHNQWMTIKNAIEDAAAVTCGIYKRGDKRIYEHQSPEQLELEEEINHISSVLADMPSTKTKQWSSLRQRKTILTKRYVTIQHAQIKVKFQRVMGELSNPQNRAALLKRTTCRAKAANQSAKALDPEKMIYHESHFKTIFGKTPATNANDANDPRVISTLILTKADIEIAVNRTSMGKAAGADGLFAEFYTYGTAIHELLTTMFNNIIKSLEIPDDWKATIVCPIFKKGDHTVAANYRPIAITSACRRIFERCIYDKLINQHVAKLEDSQNGFRPKRNCLQQIFTLHEAMQTGKAEVAFLDQTAAYDSVNRHLLWKKVDNQFNIPASTIDILKMLFDENYSRLAIKNKLSSKIQNKTGLLQGSALSPILFNFFNNDLLVKLTALEGIKVYGKKISNLAFADDIAIIANNWANLQLAINISESWAILNEMTFNPKKCSYIGHQPNGPTMYNVEISKEEKATYLGMIFNIDGIDTQASAAERANKTNQRIIMFRKMGMNLHGLTIQAAVFIYKTYIRPMLEYGLQFTCEKGLDKLQKSQNNELRAIFSANRNSSIAALHLLTKIPMIRTRQLILQASFFGMLHNNNDAAIPAVKIWWNGITEKRPKSSLITLATNKKGVFGIFVWGGSDVVLHHYICDIIAGRHISYYHVAPSFCFL
jgi:hypothetical protein